MISCRRLYLQRTVSRSGRYNARMHAKTPPLLIAAAASLTGLLAYSGIAPYDRPTWAMEVAPVAVALAILIPTWRRFPLTNLLYACIFLHAVVLIVGGTYTYARVPFGFQLAELLGGEKLPKMDVLKEKRRQLAARKKALYLEYRKAQQDMRELVAVKGSVDHLRGLTDNQRNKEQAR